MRASLPWRRPTAQHILHPRPRSSATRDQSPSTAQHSAAQRSTHRVRLDERFADCLLWRRVALPELLHIYVCGWGEEHQQRCGVSLLHSGTDSTKR